jgi:hypothetical protein
MDSFGRAAARLEVTLSPSPKLTPFDSFPGRVAYTLTSAYAARGAQRAPTWRVRAYWPQQQGSLSRCPASCKNGPATERARRDD